MQIPLPAQRGILRPIVVPGVGVCPEPVHVMRSNSREVIEIAEDGADRFVAEDRVTVIELAHVAVRAAGRVELMDKPQFAVDQSSYLGALVLVEHHVSLVAGVDATHHHISVR